MKKALVLYYSYSGNTKKVAAVLQKVLAEKYQVNMLELKALDEPDSFVRQCLRSLKKKQAQIQENISFDVSEYDLIALGTPVWAFGMAPAMRTFINKCSDFQLKDIIVFATYGSGVGKEKCLKEMAQISISRGAGVVKQFLVQQNDTADEQRVTLCIKEIL
ncbi:MAG: NAD(P)H-dependent oxidoreductase [Candidatus Omnitrophica bacterium]|nr:NAD(P)H-dependent oxidoreductase [Candidatus Omnitrophota bacterium]